MAPEVPPGKIKRDRLGLPQRQDAARYTQGYNAQVVVNEHQIVLAAEVTLSSPDFGHLQPMIDATHRELAAIGVTETPGVVVADTGYWHEQQIDHVITQGIQVLIPPDVGKRGTPRRGWHGGRYAWMRAVLATHYGAGLYGKRQPMIEPAHNPSRPLRATPSSAQL